MPEITPELLLMLFAVAGVAGFVDAVAGGGGLLTIPAMLAAGVPPVQTVATNKLQGSFGSFTAMRYFVRRGLIRPRLEVPAIIVCLLAAAAGAVAIQWFNADILVQIIPFALIGIALYLLLAKNVGRQATKARLSKTQFGGSLLPSVAFYDGFFGPGTGTFFTVGYCQLRGMNMLDATAHAKLMNFTTNIVSLAVFVFSGQIVWTVGICMAAGQVIGARLGAASAMRHGVGLIRIMTIGVCIAISLKLLLSD
ncbi:TSUP family transporter [Thalassolituus sp. UBA6592]|uniref:TSUP family transporter n=1 Tax=Thalassolituus sp. UBA6592 TaxID=1947665 RepID=UPI0025D219C9|nr:TSUP family transporter [Thalassolituus sp. UBA6592]